MYTKTYFCQKIFDFLKFLWYNYNNILYIYKFIMIKLKDIYLFQGLDWNFLEFIIDNSRRVEFEAEEIIIKEWEASDWNAYIIQKWEVEVLRNNKNIAILKAPEIFWEIALITDEVRTATIKTKTEVILLKINKDLLHKILKDFPNWDKVQKVIQTRIMENLNK